MKATLALEYIGEAQDARLALGAGIINEIIPGLGGAVVGNTRPRKPWVAKINGRDPKFGLKREFLSANWSREKANSAHSRGVYLWFVLESNHLYEVKAPASWRNSERYFCTVTESGDFRKLTKEEVDLWLRSPSGLMC